MKKYQLLISQKYLRSRAVNIVAVVAVILGVAALIIVTSVMDGFAHDIQQRVRGIMSHIVVDSDQLVGIGDYEDLIRRIEKVPDVEACSPLVECPFVLIRAGKQTRFGQLRGIDLDREKKTSEIETYLGRIRSEVAELDREIEKVRAGEEPQRKFRRQKDYNLRKLQIARTLAKQNLDFRDENGRTPPNPGAIAGIELAARLGLSPGDTISVTSPTTILTFQSKDLSVVGAFRCGHYEYDDRLLYVPLPAAQDMLGLHDRVTSISIKLRDISRAEQAKTEIEKAIRNATPLVNPAAPARLQADPGTLTTDATGRDPWLTITPGPEAKALVTIKELAPVREKADQPTTLAFDVRRTAGPTPQSAPWFQIYLVDSAGRRYCPDPEFKAWYPPPDGRKISVTCELANFVSEDGLDLLDPADIQSAVIEVRNAPLDFANIQFQDDRKVRVSTWRDKQASLLSAVDVERRMQVIIMGLMVVIAGFSILAILWLMVKEKTRDIGILMALGATRTGIICIFLLNGLLIGLLGGALGLAAGWTISINLNVIEDKIFEWTGWRAFPPDIYYLDRLPHVERPDVFILMALVAVIVSLAAALWPAIKAARLNPIEALRYE